MYISKIKIKGFRNFKETEVNFHEGVNVIIGHNNAGKSNLIHALRLVLDSSRTLNKRLDIHDFYENVTIDELKECPPLISIEVTFSPNRDKDGNILETDEDELNIISDCMILPVENYEAKLTYCFYLPENKREEYEELVSEMEDDIDINMAWRIIQNQMLRYYKYAIWKGDASQHNKIETDKLKKIDFQFLDALRDMEHDMSTGHSPLMKEVLNFFIDYKIKKEKTGIERINELNNAHQSFEEVADPLMENIQERLEDGKKEMLDYATKTGASFNDSKPDFDGQLTESDLFTALSLIVKENTGINIPVTKNGLGYNNLIFISLLLAKMQADSDGDYSGDNAKVFPVLAIEEPEAHLHPALQYQFLKYLKEEQQKKKKVKQVFVTTHSTQITSAISLDEMILLYRTPDNAVHIGYPGKVFGNDVEGKTSKNYVQRFLDATRSDMLFAHSIIFVEGTAEELLLSTFANYIGKSLEDGHVAVVNLGGRYFDHFLKLFDRVKSQYAVPVKVACITDQDQIRKLKEGEDRHWISCYPYEYGTDTDKYDYNRNGEQRIALYTTHPNIRYFSQDKDKSRTFEYDLMLENSRNDILLLDDLQNKKILKSIMDADNFSTAKVKLRKSKSNTRIVNALESIDWSDEDKCKALLASVYLNSVGKGENALSLCVALNDNLDKNAEERKAFNVPEYIKKAIEWVLS